MNSNSFILLSSFELQDHKYSRVPSAELYAGVTDALSDRFVSVAVPCLWHKLWVWGSYWTSSPEFEVFLPPWVTFSWQRAAWLWNFGLEYIRNQEKIQNSTPSGPGRSVCHTIYCQNDFYCKQESFMYHCMPGFSSALFLWLQISCLILVISKLSTNTCSCFSISWRFRNVNLEIPWSNRSLW